MNDYLINTFCSGNKIFVNMSPHGTNKLEVVAQTRLLSFNVPTEEKNRITLVDKLIDSAEEFSVLLILLSDFFFFFFKAESKVPTFPFLEQK